VVIGASISAGVLVLVALLLVLLGSAVRMKTKARKPHGAANSKHLRTKETTGASVNTVDGPNTSRETDSCVSNEAYGLSIPPSHSETHEAPQYGQQTEDDDGYVVSQLDYTNPKTLASAANAIPTTSNVAYGIYSIPTTSNEAYGALGYQHEHQRETDDTDECVANQYLELDADDIWNSVMHAIATELHS